jgi:hypothetical protein
MSPRIENNAEIPEVSDDFHELEIEAIELVEGTKYGEPETPETRVKMQLRVRTPGEEENSFQAWMSQNMGEKATLGAIIRAVFGSAPRGGVDTEDLIGKRFRTMVTHNDTGWPKLVPGTAAPVKAGKAGKGEKQPVLIGADDDVEEAPF